MNGRDLLTGKRQALLERWLERALEVYPAETRDFFGGDRGPFSNPVGFTLRRTLERLLDQVLRAGEGEESRQILEPLMKVRAVENLLPSQGTGFVLLLREILAEALAEEGRGDLSSPEWSELASRVDRLALQAFDLYMECRERVNRLRVEELKNAVRERRDRRAQN